MSSIKRQIKKFVFVVVKWTSKKCVPKSVNHMKRLLELTRGHICFSEFLKIKRRYFHSSLGKQTVVSRRHNVDCSVFHAITSFSSEFQFYHFLNF